MTVRQSFYVRVATSFALMTGMALAQSHVMSPQLEAVHPSYDLIPLRPDGWKPQITGLDFLSDGRMVLMNYRPMEIYIVDGHTKNDRTQIKWTKFAGPQNFIEPLGMTVVNDTIFVMDRDRLIRLVDSDKDGVADKYETVCKSFGIDLVNGYQEMSYNLVYKNGFFYTGLGARVNASGFVIDQQSADRSTIIKMNPVTGTHTTFVSGVRAPNGLTLDPNGEIWGTDNQGSWLVANKLIRYREGKFYGHHLFTRAATADDPVETPAAVYMEWTEISNSPGNPLYIPKGLYAGQFFVGDVKYGGIQRAYVEVVNGEYQGCYFRHSGGLESGVHKLAWGPDGELYYGGVGVCCGTHSWRSTVTGLEKLKNNGKTTFEMLKVKSRQKGMEITFTEPVGADGEAASNYVVESWYYKPTSSYGGQKIDWKPMTVKSVQLSADRKTAYLEIDGLAAGRIVYLKPKVKSQAGGTLWTLDTYYSLNAISTSQPFAVETTPVLSEKHAAAENFFRNTLVTTGNGLTLTLPEAQVSYHVEMHTLEGALAWSGALRGGQSLTLNSAQGGQGLRLLTVASGAIKHQKIVTVP